MNATEKRKQNRIPGYNYSSNGAYFITICTQHRKSILSRINVGSIHESTVIELSRYGKIVDDVITTLPTKFNIQIDNYVIMPNHIHLLITIDDDKYENRFERAIRESPLQSRSTLSKIVGYLKMNTSKMIHSINPDIDVWQRSYYDHVVRNEKDYLIHFEYIETNPIKWETDDYFIK